MVIVEDQPLLFVVTVHRQDVPLEVQWAQEAHQEHVSAKVVLLQVVALANIHHLVIV